VLVAASASAQVVLAPTVFRTAELRSNAVTSFSVACAAGYVAVSAGVSTPAPGATLLTKKPVGRRAYSFRFGNPASDAERRVTVAVACRRIRAGAPLIQLKSVARRLNVPPGAQKAITLTCPPNTTPAGSGVDVASGRASTAVRVRAATATLRGFGFTLQNSGKAARRVALYGNCITVVRSRRAARRPLQVRITTFTDLVRPGRQQVTHACPRGWFSLSAGYAAGSRLLAVEGAAAVGGGGRWWVWSKAQAETATLQLVCGRLGR
jgi:hypothetical protein